MENGCKEQKNDYFCTLKHISFLKYSLYFR